MKHLKLVLFAVLALGMLSFGASALKSQSIFYDGYEDQDLSEYTGDVSDFSIDSDDPYKGSYHLNKSSNMGSYSYLTAGSYSSQEQRNFTYWVREGDGSSGGPTETSFSGIYFDGSGSGDHYQIAHEWNIDNGGDKIRLDKRPSGDNPITMENLGVADKGWMKVRVIRNSSSGRLNITAFNEAGDVLGTDQITDTTYNSGEYGVKAYREIFIDGFNVTEIQEVSVENTSPSVSLISPSDGSNTTKSTIDFKFNITDDKNISQAELFINDSKSYNSSNSTDYTGYPYPDTPDEPVGFSDPASIDNPVLTANDVDDVADPQFVADPFIVPSACGSTNNYDMFIEVRDGPDGGDDYAKIGHAYSENGINWTYTQIVMDRGYHQSYPQVVEANNECYMVTGDNEVDVQLFRATDYPTEWTRVKNISTGAIDDNTLVLSMVNGGFSVKQVTA